MKTDREKAMEWWNSMTFDERFFKTTKNNELLGENYLRLPESLTGREIEQIWKQETKQKPIHQQIIDDCGGEERFCELVGIKRPDINSKDDDWEAKLAIENIPELSHIINSVKELRRYYIDALQLGYKKRKSEEAILYTEEEVLDLLIKSEEYTSRFNNRTDLRYWFNQNKKK